MRLFVIDVKYLAASLLACLTILGTLISTGCSSRPPVDPYAQIIGCTRPSEVDTSAIREFRILFDRVDPRKEVFEVSSGSQLTAKGTLSLQTEYQDRGDSVMLITGYRPLKNGEVDWSESPCEIPSRTEWRSGVRQKLIGGKLITEIDSRETCEAPPGDYELRFYCLQENSAANLEPMVYFIGTGRMRIIPSASPSGQ